VDIEIVTITQCVQHYNKYICKKHANTNKSTVMKQKTHTHTHMDKTVQSTYSHLIMPTQ
jgi:hypothetical protein